MKILYILTVLILCFNNVISVNKSDFAKMMDIKREQIKEMRKNNITINRRIRYLEYN